MNLSQYLLGKLAEEATEIAQISLKTQQFGFEEWLPGQTFTNAERIHQEIDDLKAVLEMLNNISLNYSENRDRIEVKKEKIIKYLNYSVQLGMVDESALNEL